MYFLNFVYEYFEHLIADSSSTSLGDAYSVLYCLYMCTHFNVMVCCTTCSSDNRGWRKRRWRDRGDYCHHPNPQPGVAKRWISQAWYDLRAVDTDQAASNYEWACFKCHQV